VGEASRDATFGWLTSPGRGLTEDLQRYIFILSDAWHSLLPTENIRHTALFLAEHVAVGSNVETVFLLSECLTTKHVTLTHLKTLFSAHFHPTAKACGYSRSHLINALTRLSCNHQQIITGQNDSRITETTHSKTM
jgi:hypothetical protein